MEKEIVKPISPKDIMDNLDKIIPSAVIESINEFLKERFRNTGSVIIKKDELITRIKTKIGVGRQEIIDNKWLDFESLYYENGWVVKYESPDRDENFEQRFTFSKRQY